jgi:hypothetical protein
MRNLVPVSNYVLHYDPQRAHHRAWLQATLERLAALEPEAFSRNGDLHSIWAASVPPKPAQPAALPLEPLLALIRSGEGNYHSVNRGRAGDTPGGWPGLTDMSIAQVMKAQAEKHVFAVGAYQFIPSTLAIAVDVAKIGTSVAFSPAVQDRLAEVLILGGKRPALRDYLIGASTDLQAAQLDLAREWAAIPGPDGRGVYDGDRGGNRAGLSVAATQAALAKARANVMAATAPLPAAPKPPSAPAITPASSFATRLTPNITLGEFALGQEARRFVTQHQVDTAILLARFLESARAHFGGRPVIITSGFRPTAINKAVGGAAQSEHLFSRPDEGAVDFYINSVDIAQVQKWCDQHWPYSVGLAAVRGFVHLGRRANGSRLRWPY